jgi:hypothetical protein
MGKIKSRKTQETLPPKEAVDPNSDPYTVMLMNNVAEWMNLHRMRTIAIVLGQENITFRSIEELPTTTPSEANR